MNDQQLEVRRTITMLKNKNVPENYLDAFTVGDSFRDTVMDLESEILALNDDQGVVEHILTGGFGTGKTHFLTYLHYLLAQHGTPEMVISRVDLSDLRDPSDLQYHIVKGLQPLKGGSYAEVLEAAFDKMVTDFMHKNRITSKVDARQALMIASVGVLETLSIVPGGGIVKNALEGLSKTPLAQRFKATFERNQSANQLRTHATQSYEEYVIDFLNLIQRKAFSEEFDSAARKLSYDGKLTDVIFKVLALAGYKTVAILVDELEAIASLGSEADPTPIRKVLTSFRSFHDDFSKAGGEQGYPSIALVIMSTNGFFQNIEKSEPALWTRWEKKERALQPSIPPQDLDYLIYQLRSLYAQAGFRLKTIENGSVAKLRESLLDALKAENKVINMREVISRIMEHIEAMWLRT